MKVGMVGQRVLYQSSAFQLFRIEPVNIGMRILCIARPAVDIALIHGPQIRDNVHIVFYYIPREICVEDRWIQYRLHYSKETTTLTSW